MAETTGLDPNDIVELILVKRATADDLSWSMDASKVAPLAIKAFVILLNDFDFPNDFDFLARPLKIPQPGLLLPHDLSAVRKIS